MTGRGPSIPPSRGKDATVEKAREQIEIWQGNRGNKLDRVIVLRDLIDAGVLRLGRGGGVNLGEAVGGSTSVGVLSNLQAVGAFENIILSWEGINQSAYSYTEIWRAETDNLGAAVLVGSSVGAVYADPVTQYKDFYYWVRAVSTSGNPGPYNATNGTLAKIAPSYEVVRDVITATEWQASTAYSPLDSVVPTTAITVEGTKIRLLALNAGTTGASEPDWATAITAIGDTVVDGTVTWEAVEAGKIPFFIDPGTGLVVIDGAALRTASIDDAKINTLSADKLFAASGTVFELLVNNGSFNTIDVLSGIRSTGYTPDTAGFLILGDGTAEFFNITARGHIEAETGYIQQTVQIGGTSKDFADVLAIESKVTDWTRPSTTLINGNKIFTGDAYVDTLQIKGQAVTFPRGSSSSSTTSASSSGTNVLSLAATVTGAPIIVQACLEFDGGGGIALGDSVAVSIRRGGTTIFGPVTVQKAYQVGSDESGPIFSLDGSGAIQAYLSSSASGTYYLHVQVNGITSINVGVRSLTILEAKR